MLKEVCKKVREKGFEIENADVTIVAQKPKLAPYIEQMVKNIAEDCKISTDCVNVKATTEEKLGFTGRKEGVSAHSVCLIEK